MEQETRMQRFPSSSIALNYMFHFVVFHCVPSNFNFISEQCSRTTTIFIINISWHARRFNMKMKLTISIHRSSQFINSIQFTPIHFNSMNPYSIQFNSIESSHPSPGTITMISLVPAALSQQLRRRRALSSCCSIYMMVLFCFCCIHFGIFEGSDGVTQCWCWRKDVLLSDEICVVVVSSTCYLCVPPGTTTRKKKKILFNV